MAPTALPNVLAADLPSVIPAASSQSAPIQWPIVPQEGESFADTMKRAVEQAKSDPSLAAEIKANRRTAIKEVPLVASSALLSGPALLTLGEILPEAASSAAGGGVLGSTVGGAAAGAGTEVLNKSLHGLAGENVFTPKSAKDIGESAIAGGAAGLGLGFLGKVLNTALTSKLARGMINESVGATARDVTYGNPAVAALDENITSPFTGDIEKYKDALRAGVPHEQALVAAGGRVAGAAQKISELAPQVDQILSKSSAQIPVSDVIDKPLLEAASGIIDNPAMTQAEKDTALTQIGALQQSLKEGINGPTLTPLEANKIKQAIGNRINWAGNIAVTDEVKPAYRAVFGALKESVNNAVPEVSGVNERLTNLLALQTDLERLMKAEEVGQGKGALGSAVTGIARRAEAVAGRAIPTLARTANVIAPSSVPVGAAAGLFKQPFGSLQDMIGGQ